MNIFVYKMWAPVVHKIQQKLVIDMLLAWHCT
jgi:hypothetical protein